MSYASVIAGCLCLKGLGASLGHMINVLEEVLSGRLLQGSGGEYHIGTVGLANSKLLAGQAAMAQEDQIKWAETPAAFASSWPLR
jgi:hypothetical protein